MITEKTAVTHPSIFTIWSNTYKTLKDSIKIFFPFLVIAILELVALTILYYFPRKPVSIILAPIISRYWGAGYLHYPLNFFLLPKLLYYARLLIGVLFSSLAIGMAVSLYEKLSAGRPARFFDSFKLALKRYPSLFLAQLLLYCLYLGINKIIDIGIIKYFLSGHTKLLFLSFRVWRGPLSIVISTLSGIFIQMFFVYIAPYIILSKKSLFSALISGLRLSKRLFFRTLILVGLPTVLYLPVVIIIFNLKTIVYKISPEFTLVVLGFSVLLGTLVVDAWIMMSSTESFLSEED